MIHIKGQKKYQIGLEKTSWKMSKECKKSHFARGKCLKLRKGQTTNFLNPNPGIQLVDKI